MFITRSKALRSLVIGVLLVAMGFVLGSSDSYLLAVSDDNTVQEPDMPREAEYLLETERLFSEIYEQAAPGVVAIRTAQSGAGDNFFDASTGSGFVVDEAGHIVTNFHVIDDADRIEIRMFDGTITLAEEIGTDPDSDIAVIKVDVPPDRLYPLPLANSNQLRVGQTVLAIGNPFENDWTLTSGIVSALNRTITGLNNYSIGGVIQTDAAINPGNSGGPLLNLRGEVVGVNSQIDSQFRQNAGIGFAVPSNLVQRVMRALIDQGGVRYSYIGINSRPIDYDLISDFNLPDNLQGVAVWQARSDGPARAAGLRTISTDSVDVITAIDDQPVRSFDEMVAYLAINTAPGQTVNLTIFRDGTYLNIPVTLSERP